MASGYEKAACGIDPNTGWNSPEPDASPFARIRTFALWATLTVGWVLTSPTGIAIRQLLDL